MAAELLLSSDLKHWKYPSSVWDSKDKIELNRSTGNQKELKSVTYSSLFSHCEPASGQYSGE